MPTVPEPQRSALATSIGLFYAWWRADPLPALPPLAGLSVEAPTEERRTVALTGYNGAEVRARRAAGHQPYVARLGATVVAAGWSAGREATIGSAGLAFALPPGHRYLWDFVTLPAWRGRGLYPRLLQAVLVQESVAADRFWIGHDRENVASAHGIRKAGFQAVGELLRRPDGSLVLHGCGIPERARAATLLLNVPLLMQDVGNEKILTDGTVVPTSGANP